MIERFNRRFEVRPFSFDAYVTIRTFPDPTAQTAVKRVGHMTLAMTRTREITALSEQIAALKQNKRDGKIDKSTFMKLREPLRDKVKELTRMQM